MNSDGATAVKAMAAGTEHGSAENGVSGGGNYGNNGNSHAPATNGVGGRSGGGEASYANGGGNIASPSSSRISMAALCSPVSSPRPVQTVSHDASSSSLASTSRTNGSIASIGNKPRTRRESAAAAAVAAAEADNSDKADSRSNGSNTLQSDATGDDADSRRSPRKVQLEAAAASTADDDTDMPDAADSRLTGSTTLSGTSIDGAATGAGALKGNADTSKEASSSKVGDRSTAEDAAEDQGDDDEGDEDEDDEDEEDEDEDDDEDDDGEDSDDGSAKSDDMEGVETASTSSKREGKARAEPENSEATTSDLPAKGDDQPSAEAETSKAGAVKVRGKPGPKPKGDKEKKKKKRERSPSIDVSLPAGPPPRPTIRMKLSIAKTDEAQYLVNVPEEMYKLLKPKNDPWAEWYERKNAEDSAADAADEAGDVTPNGDGEMPPDLEGLGDLARLLHKYPSNAPSGKGRKGKKKKGKADDIYEIGQYDTKDPFVDDSELGVDEPTHQAKPSSDGFFVTKGEVQLERLKRDEAAQQSRDSLLTNLVGSKRSQIPAGFGEPTDTFGGAGAMFLQAKPNVECLRIVNIMISQQAVELGILTPSAEHEDASRKSYFGINALLNGNAEPTSSLTASSQGDTNGTRQSPIKVEDEKRSTPSLSTATNTSGKAFKYPAAPVPERLQREFDKIQIEVSQTSWREKAKFPPTLREPLFRAARVAIALNEYNENFFNWLPRLIPYNRLTLHKYVKRHFCEEHIELMRKVQEKHFAGFKQQVEELWPMVKKEYEDKVADFLGKGGKMNGTPAPEAPGSASQDAPQARESAARDEGGNEGAEEEATADGSGDTVADGNEPIKRWPWTEPLRETLFTIMTIDNAQNEVRTEKYGLESSNERTSYINSRKIIYKRMLEFWPENGWMTTTNLSNTYGLYKRKVDRFAAMLDEARGRDADNAIAL